MYNLTPQEELPSMADIHYWTHRDDDKDDNEMVCRMIDLSEYAEELESAKEAKRRFSLYRGIVELLDD